MSALENIIVTDVQQPFIVHSEKDRKFQMTDRPSYGLSLCMSGKITYTMDGKDFVSEPECAVLLPKGGTYSLFGDKEGMFPVINFQCENFSCDEIMVFSLENPQACIQDFDTLRNLFLYGKDRLKIYSVFYELLSKVSSDHTQRHTPIDPVIRFIERNIKNPILSNTELAKQIGISEVYLRKLFLAYYTITPKQYILDIRIRKAKQLLCDTQLSVSAIAEECGFSSVYHFCRAFKNKTGTTPTEYAGIHKVYQI